nr:MAG TPA: hypothetical protein [Caudoviricetes sp.]
MGYKMSLPACGCLHLSSRRKQIPSLKRILDWPNPLLMQRSSALSMCRLWRTMRRIL